MNLLNKLITCTRIFKSGAKNFAVHLIIIARYEISLLSLQIISPRQLTWYIYTIKSELLSRLIRFTCCCCHERGHVHAWNWQGVSAAMVEDEIAR